MITGYHAAGTCKMGKSDDERAVVDGNLKVHGMRGLREADTSIIPKLHSGPTQMVASQWARSVRIWF
jgi:choline dehydrogenase